MIRRLAPDSEPPEEEEEAQSEGKEEAVVGLKIGWILPVLRRLRAAWPEVTGEGHGYGGPGAPGGTGGS